MSRWRHGYYSVEAISERPAARAAMDCGVAVNPDTIKAQLQSGIIFGIRGVLYGEITLKKGRVEQNNF